MKRYITLLPFSANQQDILLVGNEFVSHKLKAEDDVEQSVVEIFKKATGIKSKLKDWDLFAKNFEGNEAITFYYRAFKNFIYDYKNLNVLGSQIANVKEINNNLYLQLALKDFDMAELHKF